MRSSMAALMLVLGLTFGPRALSQPAEVAPPLGAGSIRCFELVRLDPSEDRTVRNWLAGYLSGYNQYASVGPGKILFLGYDEEHVLEAVQRYCRDRPESTVMQATAAFISDLTSARREITDGRSSGPGLR